MASREIIRLIKGCASNKLLEESSAYPGEALGPIFLAWDYLLCHAQEDDERDD
jgi:hypothetical protein